MTVTKRSVPVESVAAVASALSTPAPAAALAFASAAASAFVSFASLAFLLAPLLPLLPLLLFLLRLSKFLTRLATFASASLLGCVTGIGGLRSGGGCTCTGAHTRLSGTGGAIVSDSCDGTYLSADHIIHRHLLVSEGVIA